MEKTTLMGWTAHNKLYLTGTITAGLTLSPANSDSGSIPGDMSISTYDDYNYDASTYELTAVYEGTYESSFSVSDITWVVAGATTNDIKYQYNSSDDGITYDGWTTENDAVGTTNIQIRKPYFKIRFIYYSPSWSDSDSIYISTIQQYFKYFNNGEIIYSSEMNENFQVVGVGDMMPRGGNGMVFTTGAYDLGSVANKWKTIWCNTLNVSGEIKNTFYPVTQTVLAASATAINIDNLDTYSGDSYWMMNYSLYIESNTVGSSFMYFNYDSANSYYYTNIWMSTKYSGISTSGILYDNNLTTSITSIYSNFDGFILCESGKFKSIIGSGSRSMATEIITTENIVNGLWLETATAISSINFRLVSGASFYPGSKVNLYRRNS